MEQLLTRIFSNKSRKQIQYDLKWNLLRCVTKNGGKNISEGEEGKFTKLVKM